MEDYIIITDSTTDFSPNLIKELELEVLPLHFNIDGKMYGDYSDGRDICLKDFYNKLRNGETSTTSQVNPEDFLKSFKVYLEKGLDIIYIAFSSALSSTYSSAVIAANELKELFPNRKITVIDSLCASLGEGLLVYLAVKEKRSGKSFEELEKWVNNNKLKVCHWFTVDDLHHLKRGGRVSSTSAILGSMLNIKPILHVDNNGRLVLVTKSRGRQKSINTLIDKIDETAIDIQNQTIFISHGDCEEDATYMANLIKERYKVKDVIINTIGPVIGSHAGPGTLTLFFMGTKR